MMARSLRELRHYGFIVEMQTYCLGVLGKGKATHWRLTELGYMHEPPTRDFLKWDGEMFHEQKSPAYHKRQKRSLAKLKKQNPVPLHGTGCTKERNITVYQGAEHLPDKVFQGAAHTSQTDCTMERHIFRYNHYAAPDVPLVPSAPDVPDINGHPAKVGGIEISPNTWIDDWDGLPPDKEMVDAYIAAWLETGSDLSVPALA